MPRGFDTSKGRIQSVSSKGGSTPSTCRERQDRGLLQAHGFLLSSTRSLEATVIMPSEGRKPGALTSSTSENQRKPAETRGALHPISGLVAATGSSLPLLLLSSSSEALRTTSIRESGPQIAHRFPP